MEVSGQLHFALPPKKEPPAPIGQKFGCAPQPTWKLWRGEQPLTSAEGQPGRSQEAIPTKS
jgi:hypothetical protein